MAAQGLLESVLSDQILSEGREHSVVQLYAHMCCQQICILALQLIRASEAHHLLPLPYNHMHL